MRCLSGLLGLEEQHCWGSRVTLCWTAQIGPAVQAFRWEIEGSFSVGVGWIFGLIEKACCETLRLVDALQDRLRHSWMDQVP